MNPSLIKGDQALNFSFHKALWSYSDQLLQYIYLKAFESSIVLWCGFCCFAFLKLSILEIFLFPHPLSREKGNVEITDFQIFSHNFSSLPTFLPLTFTRLPNTPILFFFFSVPPFSPPARLSIHFSHPPTLSSQQGFMGFEVGWSSAVSNCSCILA